MTTYKILLAFKGSRYFGWQKQKDFQPTVQGELEKSLQILFKSQDIHTIGSGRTDTGVHSLGHVVRVRAPFDIEPESLGRALNSNLPPDIRVLTVEYCDEEFRPTYDAIKKEYKYLFTNNKVESPFQSELVVNYPFELNFEAMAKACKLFEGEWDFANFSCAGSDPASTVRTIFECELTIGIQPNLQEILPAYHCVRIVGSGFLKQMVRLVVGCLWHVGRGKLTEREIKRALLRDREFENKRLGEVAPACGLYKVKTWY